MKYAWIENERIRDIAPGNPEDYYAAEVAAFYSTQVPDTAVNGDGWVNEQIVKPLPPEPSAPIQAVPPKVSPIQYKLLFTSAERIAISTAKATDPVLQDLYGILDDPRLTEVDLALQSTQDALDYLTAKGLIAAGRKAEILLGVIK